MYNPADPGRSYYSGGGLTGGAFGHPGGPAVPFGGGYGSRRSVMPRSRTGISIGPFLLDGLLGLPSGFTASMAPQMATKPRQTVAEEDCGPTG